MLLSHRIHRAIFAFLLASFMGTASAHSQKMEAKLIIYVAGLKNNWGVIKMAVYRSKSKYRASGYNSKDE